MAKLCPDPCDPMDRSTPGSLVFHSHPLSLFISSSLYEDDFKESFPMSHLFASGRKSIGVSGLVPVLPMNISGFISFRIDWFDLLAVQGTLKCLLQHHRSKASVLQHSTFFMIQLSHPYMTTGKTIALTRQTFIGKVISMLFNTLSRFVIAFLSRSSIF